MLDVDVARLTGDEGREREAMNGLREVSWPGVAAPAVAVVLLVLVVDFFLCSPPLLGTRAAFEVKLPTAVVVLRAFVGDPLILIFVLAGVTAEVEI